MQSILQRIKTPSLQVNSALCHFQLIYGQWHLGLSLALPYKTQYIYSPLKSSLMLNTQHLQTHFLPGYTSTIHEEVVTTHKFNV